ncbi:MAG TPA: helix-turn-helix domain-containing protein [Xanthomonadaceae bacterium]|nr:helix-turn-helix domain-containing protein [Xanthomonadaceae bacterium]
MTDTLKPLSRARKTPAGRKSASRTGRPANDAGRRARRERLRDHTREEILDAARRVVLERGIAGTTLEAVARDVGMSKAALYYYFPSKDALLFALVFEVMAGHARTIHDAVEQTTSGGAALGAIVRESFAVFSSRLDDFRLAFLHAQVTGKGTVRFDEAQFAHVRPLNDLWFEGAAKKLRERRRKRNAPGAVEPRLMAFLAYCSTIGLLTMKGMVESLDDPLRYSDEQLVEGLASVFEAAATSWFG